ncbi:hypothetical protein [Sphingobium sufflavum]|uniref:hypothetical protein n=1 Tax=Sphingobium sufflavum TaxID=1129547 RepID=UPI001F421D61|nr:hypothetical protein [Sphingobium sufflavum]
MSEPFAVRLATVRRGALFVASGCQAPGGGMGTTVTGPYRAKVIGNSLRELDRFLNLLADEVGRTMARSAADMGAIRREHNTANKIRGLRGRRGLASPDHDRLRALGRSRDCMVHCDGLVKRGDGPDAAYLTLGWTAGGWTQGVGTEGGGSGAGCRTTGEPPAGLPLLRAGVGERIEVTRLSLIDVGEFYLAAAAALVALRG